MTIGMFLGISWLATHIAGITISEERSVVAQIAHAVFGGGLGFYLVQAFTAAILILAANTAYQDFPRLSSILARDGFMPSQFRNRGDRLVFSNGVIVLAVLAGGLIYVFDANLSRLIQLYVVGVFTSFTLSQAGMVRHWLKERRRGPAAARGWQRSIVINSVGAATTGLVLVVITATKFVHGAWIVITAMPFIVFGLLAVHRHYQHVAQALHAHQLTLDRAATHRFVFIVRDLGPATHEALAQVRALRPESVTPLYVGPPKEFETVEEGWTRMAGRLGALQQLASNGHGTVSALRVHLQGLVRDEHTFVTVVIPEEVSGSSWWELVWRQRFAFFLKARMLFAPDVAVMDLPLVPEEREGALQRAAVETETGRSVVLIPVSSIHDGTIRAMSYARALESAHIEALYFAADPEIVHDMAEQWWTSGVDIPLSFVEAPFRDLAPPLLEEIRRYTERPDTVVAVVLPEFLATRWWEHLLHGQTALYIKRLLLAEPRTAVVSVPYRVPRRERVTSQTRS
jgi:hypothetical protein